MNHMNIVSMIMLKSLKNLKYTTTKNIAKELLNGGALSIAKLIVESTQKIFGQACKIDVPGNKLSRKKKASQPPR